MCAGISEDELRYSCKGSFQKTIWQTSTYKAVYTRLEQVTGCLCKGKKILGDHQYQRAELDYRIDICRVTKGSHIEHL